MKYLKKFFLIALMLCFAFFTGCEKNVYVTIEEIDSVTMVPDTVVISSEFSYRIDGGEDQSYNGLGASCLIEDWPTEAYINFIAYGADLTIRDNIAFYEEEIFSIWWITDTKAEEGEHSAFGNIISPESDTIRTLANLNISYIEEDRIIGEITGTFIDPNTEETIAYEGTYNLERYECYVFGDELPPQ